jgi:hypothetical protein
MWIRVRGQVRQCGSYLIFYNITIKSADVDKGSHPEKKSASVWNFSKGGGGGGHVGIQTLRGNFLFCSCLDIFQKGGGGFPNTKLVEELFSLYLEIFQERGGGVTLFQTFEELLCLSLDIFKEERGGGLPDS